MSYEARYRQMQNAAEDFAGAISILNSCESRLNNVKRSMQSTSSLTAINGIVGNRATSVAAVSTAFRNAGQCLYNASLEYIRGEQGAYSAITGLSLPAAAMGVATGNAATSVVGAFTKVTTGKNGTNGLNTAEYISMIAGGVGSLESLVGVLKDLGTVGKGIGIAADVVQIAADFYNNNIFGGVVGIAETGAKLALTKAVPVAAPFITAAANILNHGNRNFNNENYTTQQAVGRTMIEGGLELGFVAGTLAVAGAFTATGVGAPVGAAIVAGTAIVYGAKWAADSIVKVVTNGEKSGIVEVAADGIVAASEWVGDKISEGVGKLATSVKSVTSSISKLFK